MKMVKSLLLGSAAGVVAITGAQAADLPVKAKPVQYVKICTLYGDGFYYIPGSDTCIRFNGYIRADYNFNGRSPHVSGANGAQDRTVATLLDPAPRELRCRHAYADCLRHAADVYERQLRQRTEVRIRPRRPARSSSGVASPSAARRPSSIMKAASAT